MSEKMNEKNFEPAEIQVSKEQPLLVTVLERILTANDRLECIQDNAFQNQAAFLCEVKNHGFVPSPQLNEDVAREEVLDVGLKMLSDRITALEKQVSEYKRVI